MPVHIQCLHSPIVLHPKPSKFVILVKSGLSVSFLLLLLEEFIAKSSTIRFAFYALNLLR